MDGAYPLRALLFAALCLGLPAQKVAENSEPLRIGPGVTAPKLTHKVEPKYSPEAERNHVQGTAVFELVVDENGLPANIRVISPLGFGLDEQGQAALEQWRFVPGTKEGKPVKIVATVEVNFRLLNRSFNEKIEHQRTAYNMALEGLKGNEKAKERAIESMKSLAQSQMPAAMYLVGKWELAGEYLQKDPAEGLALFQKSAEKDYGPAIYEIARRTLEGQDGPPNLKDGLEHMRRGAVLGSVQAQFDLGIRYQKGKDVEVDAERARRYFRLCGSRGVPECEFSLANLL